MAFEWVRLGYKVVLSARRKELLEEIALQIKNSGGEALVVPVDIMEEKSIENAVQSIITTWGRLDVAVANAGFGVFGSIDKLTAKDWNRQLQGNVTGLALTVKLTLKKSHEPSAIENENHTSIHQHQTNKPTSHITSIL
jgi:NADP-dependent 3-hydroxy acid dehydrogenase YdfG